MTSLHVIYGLALPQSKILATSMHKTMCNMHSRLLHLSIVDAPSRAVAYNISKMQSSEIYVALLQSNISLVWKYGMEYGRKFYYVMEYGMENY